MNPDGLIRIMVEFADYLFNTRAYPVSYTHLDVYKRQPQEEDMTPKTSTARCTS